MLKVALLKSEDTGEFLLLQNKYSKSLSWAENLNKLFTDLGGKSKFSAQDIDLEYLSWRSKNPLGSSDFLKPPLTGVHGWAQILTMPIRVTFDFIQASRNSRKSLLENRPHKEGFFSLSLV